MRKSRVCADVDICALQWLVPRRQRMQFDPRYQNQYNGQPMDREQAGYAMNGYAAPPPGMSTCLFPSPLLPLILVPVYDRNHENVPAYLPPQGASKANPDQGDYASVPPPGAPPMRYDEAPAYPAPVAGSSARQ
jgi:hypothetical protein